MKAPARMLAVCVAGAPFVCAPVANAADVPTGSTNDDVAAAPLGFNQGGTSGSASPHNFFTYGADAGIGYSDNITETSTNKRSDEMLSIGLQLAGLEQDARFQGAVLGQLEHLNYLQSTYGPEVIGNLGGYASYAVVPDYVHWVAQDSFGQGLIDPFVSQAPGNLENINTFTTGPTFTIPVGALTLLSVSARYSRVYYQVSPLDSNDYGGALSLTRLLSARSRISVNVQDERYEYTYATNPSYDQREAFVRYDMQGARTHIAADLGYGQFHGPQGVDSGGALGRLSISRTVAEGSVVSLAAGRELSNSSNFLTQYQSTSGIGLQVTPGQQSATPFTNEYESLGWSFVRRRTTLTANLSHYLQVFDGRPDLDQSATNADARLSRLVYPGWTAGLFADYSKQSFASFRQLLPFQRQTGNYTQEHAGVYVRWQPARKLGVTFEYDHYHRNSDQALYTFSENRLWVRLYYGSATPNGPLGSGDQSPAMSVINTDRFSIPAPAH